MQTKWQWNLFYSKVFARSVNTLPHWETIRLIPVFQKVVGRWWIHNLTHFCTSSSEWNRRPRMFFFRSPKIWKSQGERSGLYGGCWSVSQRNLWSLSLARFAVWGMTLSCKRMIRSDSIPVRFYFMARRSTLSHLETKHTSFFFACLHSQCRTNTLYTTLISRAIKKQLCGYVRFHYVCLLPYRWQYRYVRTVLPAFARNVFFGGCLFFIWLLLIVAVTKTNGRGDRSCTYLGQQMSITRIDSLETREMNLSRYTVPFVNSRKGGSP